MAIGPLNDFTSPIRAGNWTIIQMGRADVETYQRTRRELEKARGLTKDKARRETLGEMIGDCDYIIEWLRTGRRPGAMRGAEKPYSTSQSNVERVVPWDPSWIEVYSSPNGWSGYTSRDLTDDEQWRITDALSTLSKRERECYVLYHSFGYSERDIAFELHMSRTAVQKFLERASIKIENAKMNSLFLLE